MYLDHTFGLQTFSGTVRAWRIKKFSNRGVVRVTWLPIFLCVKCQ